MLERIEPSPLHTMNRAVAIAEWQGPAAGLAVLKALASGAYYFVRLANSRGDSRVITIEVIVLFAQVR